MAAKQDCLRSVVLGPHRNCNAGCLCPEDLAVVPPSRLPTSVLAPPFNPSVSSLLITIKMLVTILIVASLAVVAYAYHVANALATIPAGIHKLSQGGWNREQILEASRTARTAEEVSRPKLPPKQNRRYIVVGSSGKSTT